MYEWLERPWGGACGISPKMLGNGQHRNADRKRGRCEAINHGQPAARTRGGRRRIDQRKWRRPRRPLAETATKKGLGARRRVHQWRSGATPTAPFRDLRSCGKHWNPRFAISNSPGCRSRSNVEIHRVCSQSSPSFRNDTISKASRIPAGYPRHPHILWSFRNQF